MAMWWNSSSVRDFPAMHRPLRVRGNIPFSPWRAPAVTTLKCPGRAPTLGGPFYMRMAVNMGTAASAWMRVALVALLVCVPGSINLSITLLPLLLACAMLLNPPVRRRPTFLG